MGNLCSRDQTLVALPPNLKSQSNIIHNEDELIFSPGIFVRENEGSIYSLYKFDTVLGSGRNGTIRKCTHKPTNDERVVKIISKADLPPDEVLTRAVFKEVEILKTVDHPNLPRIYEFFEDDANFYIVLELCTGGDLFDKIVEQKTFNETQAAEIMYQILSGLTYLHAKKIIHRDIKPENILLTKKDAFELKIIDFDSATFFSSGYNRGIYGTPLYMAPEIIKGKHTEICDIWSCGMIMYILFVGHPPYDGTDDEIFEILKHPKINIEKDCENISNDAKDLLYKLLEPDPNKRITAKDACMHPWLKSKLHKRVSSMEIKKVVKRMKNFKKTSKIREAIHTFIISKIMDPNQFKVEEKVFNLVDANCDGIITINELLDLFKNEMPFEEAVMYSKFIMENADSDKNGYIDYTEFLRATIKTTKICTKENLLQAFNFFDENNNGVIEFDELSHGLSDGAVITEKLIREIMNQVDTNGDGCIDIFEFEDLLVDALDNQSDISV
jgi:calcium-dependent protein kinase